MFSERTRWNRQKNHLGSVLDAIRSSGREIQDLTRSNPTECGFAYDEESVRAALSQDAIFRYKPDAYGIESARQAVALYYKGQHGATLSHSDLVLTSGTSEAYSFLFRLLCNPGDEVLIPAPGYPLFDFLADLCDVKLVRFPLVYDHGWQIDFAGLAAAATERTRAVIVVHPNNPTGHYVSPAEQRQLAEFCRSRAMTLIVDEVFLDFALRDGTPARTFAENAATLTFALSGLSKTCGLPQMKLAWIAVNGPEDEKREALERLEVISDSYLSVGTAVQVAVPVLLNTRTAFQEQVKERLRRNLAELDRQLTQQTVCSRLECEGGWTAVMRVPSLPSDEETAVELLQKREVLVYPGHFYDFPQPGWLVVSLIVPEQEFAEGIRQVMAHFAG